MPPSLRLGAEAPQRHGLAHLAQHGAGLGRVVVHAAGGDVARRHGVDAHAAVRPIRAAAVSVKLTMPARAAPLWPMFGIEPQMSATMLTMAPPCCCIDCTIALARDQKAAGEVGGDHRLPALGADLFHRRDVLAAGVVDEPVDAAVHGDDGLHRRPSPPSSSRMSQAWKLARPPSATISPATPCSLSQLAADQHHMRAERREFVRDAAADAANRRR